MKKTPGKTRLLNLFLSISAPLFLLLAWYIASTYGYVRSSILPSPQKIVSTLASLAVSGKLWKDMSISIIRVLRGFLVGAVAGIFLGALMGFFPPINRVASTLVSIFRPIPMLAWIPIFILWLGIGEPSKTAVIFIGSFWSVLLNTIHGIQSTDPKLLEVARILEKPRLTIIFKIYLPSALPSIFTGLRLGIGSAWTCVVGAEMIAATSGIGYMIHYARELAQPARVYAGVLCIGIVGILIDKSLSMLQRKLLSWSYENQ
ncbi:MAG: ABC transporter permease [Clostridiales bacterium]|nr:ABC transporter permease [Clostridiales bacterium]